MNSRHEIELLEQAFGQNITDVARQEIGTGNSGMYKARTTGSAGGRRFSVIVKRRHGERVHKALWYADDPGIADREYQTYALLEQRKVPHARVVARRYNAADDWTLILDDLAESHTLPDAGYRFSEADQDAIVETYAAIHAVTLDLSASPEMRQAVGFLQPEEGSQVDASTAGRMLEVLQGHPSGACRLLPSEFREAVATLLQARLALRDAPRALVFNDFDQSNVALPTTPQEQAIIFDWELAGVGLPQFDLINFAYGRAECDFDRTVRFYVACMGAKGVLLDADRFRVGMAYAHLSGQLYLLWLLHLKLLADPTGKLPGWMRRGAEKLFGGELVMAARELSAMTL